MKGKVTELGARNFGLRPLVLLVAGVAVVILVRVGLVAKQASANERDTTCSSCCE